MATKRNQVVVLDINGILADIRRREAPLVTDKDPDAILPNGQKAYMHPLCHQFLHSLLDLPNVTVVLYTSRLKHNSEPVERLLEPEIRKVAAVLHGEDCLGPDLNAPGTEKYHPRKTSTAVTSAAKCREEDIIFVDDNPHRIVTERKAARAIKAGTFDARRPRETQEHLASVWWSLTDMLQKK
jgi:hypothetical protein